MDQIIITFLSKLELGELQTFNNMSIIPLFNSMNHAPQYLSLGEAMRKGFLTVTEVSQAGAVPELKVVNKADLAVLLLGREKASSVSRTLKENMTYRGDQGEVWNGIDRISAEACVHSKTGAMRDVFENKKEDLEGYLTAFKYVPHQKGILVMMNGRVIGLDILSFEPVYEALHPKLVKSYAMDALLQQQREKVDNGSAEKARRFIEEARQCKEEKFMSVGHGWDHRFDGPAIVGSVLVHQEKVIHMAFFSMSESERVGKMSSASRRRNFRTT